MVLTMFTFAEVCLVIALADSSALGMADTMLAEIENHVEIAVSMRHTDSADIAMHDTIVDSDPMWLEWDSVQRTRDGRPWACYAEGVDSLPVVGS